MNRTVSIEVKAIRWVIAIGFAIMLVKFIAFFVTHSNAILTDALESVINVVAGLFAYYSLYLSAKPKDADHPYGHGKIEFISAGFEGAMILIAGLAMIIKSVSDLLHPVEVKQLNVGVMLAGAAGMINFILAKYLMRVGKSKKSIILVADGKHLMSDTYSSIGLIAGLVIIHFTKQFWLDSVLAILFGIIIIFTGYRLVRKSIAGLMDEADETVLSEVVTILNENRRDKWIDMHNLRLQQYGSNFHIDCHITLPWYDNLQTAHDELKNIEHLVHQKFHNKVELFIHPDPCLPFSCSICQLKNCHVRQKPFEKTVEWKLENLLKNQKHGLG